ncbi:MAG TPA: hypothetical protein VGK13_07650 [Methanocellaceae archaeon]
MLIYAIAPGAISQGAMHGNKTGKMMNIDESYAAIVVTGVSDQSATYQVLSMGFKTKDNKAMVKSLKKPMSAQYFFSNNTVFIAGDHMCNKTGNKTWKHHDHKLVDYSNATINVAGASAVIAKKNVTVLKHDNTSTEMQFTGMSVYLPDGTTKSYMFATPVKVVFNKKDKKATITGDPAFNADIRDGLKALSGGKKFPANAAPVPLSKIG